MPRNVEIKAKVHNLLQLIENAKRISNEDGVVLEQKDIFYVCENGRLKLRSVKTKKTGSQSELIFYRRPDEDGPKVSSFVITPVDDPNTMDEILTRSLGSEGIVAKTRTLFMVGQTRVHIDSVEGLGDFMELEVQLNRNQALEEGSRIAEDLMKKLGIKKADLITGAYHDLLKKKKAFLNTNM